MPDDVLDHKESDNDGKLVDVKGWFKVDEKFSQQSVVAAGVAVEVAASVVGK